MTKYDGWNAANRSKSLTTPGQSGTPPAPDFGCAEAPNLK
jgi:hypothetical protein